MAGSGTSSRSQQAGFSLSAVGGAMMSARIVRIRHVPTRLRLRGRQQFVLLPLQSHVQQRDMEPSTTCRHTTLSLQMQPNYHGRNIYKYTCRSYEEFRNLPLSSQASHDKHANFSILGVFIILLDFDNFLFLFLIQPN
jgi:hypothetical protein